MLAVSKRIVPSSCRRSRCQSTSCAAAGVLVSKNSMRVRTGAAATLALLCTPSSTTALLSLSSRNLSLNMSPPEARTTTETATESQSSTSSSTPILQNVQQALQNSWIRQLSPESDQNVERSRLKASLPSYMPIEDVNRRKRPVLNGHYVLVKPTPLNAPRLVLYSSQVAHDMLHLSTEQVQSPEFLSWVSGGTDGVFGSSSSEEQEDDELSMETWATPYALSIMGTRYTNNCPYGTGDGYGDGRAISIGELHDHELQLKGAGTTPFHRGADGRAVLRSSIREFLASEAMHHLGVPTTRALSLVVSETDTTQRPWYSDASTSGDSFSAVNGNRRSRLPSLDDPRLQNYSLAERKQIIAQLRSSLKDDPNIMIVEKLAITCRVASSFTRIGHIDLFARRAEVASMKTADKTNSRWDTSTLEWKELEQIIWHACYREFRESAYLPYFETNDLAAAATVLLQESAVKLSQMVAHWVRVGFAQGNFNGDNCLVGGKTMDYGPFGFMEEYNPLFAKWTGSGNHFGFLNQPSAGFANYQVLVESVAPVICAAKGLQDPTDTIKEFLTPASALFQSAVDETLRVKLGFAKDQDVGDDVWEALEPLLRVSRVDWTLFFRQLTYIARDFDLVSTHDDYDAMMKALEGDDVHSPFYEPLDEEMRQAFVDWLKQWKTSLVNSGSAVTAYDRMRTANPKYVLREWMMVEAYSAAAKGEEAELFNLYSLIQHPYEEGSDHEVARYYRRAPDEALASGGTAFMS